MGTMDVLPGLLKTGGPDGTAAIQQKDLGSILVYPPQLWDEERRSLKEWLSDEAVPFRDLSYGIEDILPFAGVNYSPDRWFFVTRGAMEGKVFWWQHDDAPQISEPWAENLDDWAARVWREVPDVFGGCIRFDKRATPDEVPDGAELFPEKFVLERP